MSVKVISITLILLLIAASTMGYIALAGAQELPLARRIAYAPGQVIVKFHPGVIHMPSYLTEAGNKELIVNSKSLQTLNEKYGLVSMTRLNRSKDSARFEDVYVLKFSDSIDVIRISKEYSQDPNVIYARPNYIVFYYTGVSATSIRLT